MGLPAPPPPDDPQSLALLGYYGFNLSHRASRYPGGVLCWSCGAFSSSSRAVGLRRQCPGVPSPSGITIIERVAAGKAARWLPDDPYETSRRDREFTLERAWRVQAASRESRRLGALLKLRLNSKSTPCIGPSVEEVRHGFRLVRKTAPNTLTILEPKRHRSAQVTALEDNDPDSELEGVLEDDAQPQSLLSDVDLIGALDRDEIFEALSWPSGEAEAEIQDGDPFGHGWAMG